MNKFTRSQMGKIMAYALSAAMAVTVVPTYMMKPLVAEAADVVTSTLNEENIFVKEITGVKDATIVKAYWSTVNLADTSTYANSAAVDAAIGNTLTNADTKDISKSVKTIDDGVNTTLVIDKDTLDEAEKDIAGGALYYIVATADAAVTKEATSTTAKYYSVADASVTAATALTNFKVYSSVNGVAPTEVSGATAIADAGKLHIAATKIDAITLSTNGDQAVLTYSLDNGATKKTLGTLTKSFDGASSNIGTITDGTSAKSTFKVGDKIVIDASTTGLSKTGVVGLFTKTGSLKKADAKYLFGADTEGIDFTNSTNKISFYIPSTVEAGDYYVGVFDRDSVATVTKTDASTKIEAGNLIAVKSDTIATGIALSSEKSTISFETTTNKSNSEKLTTTLKGGSKYSSVSYKFTQYNADGSVDTGNTLFTVSGGNTNNTYTDSKELPEFTVTGTAAVEDGATLVCEVEMYVAGRVNPYKRSYTFTAKKDLNLVTGITFTNDEYIEAGKSTVVATNKIPASSNETLTYTFTSGTLATDSVGTVRYVFADKNGNGKYNAGTDTLYATFDEATGEVVTKKAGEYTITATGKNTGVSKATTVTALDFKFATSGLVVDTNNGALSNKVVATPALDNTKGYVTYTVEDPSIATINNSTVAYGTALTANALSTGITKVAADITVYGSTKTYNFSKDGYIVVAPKATDKEFELTSVPNTEAYINGLKSTNNFYSGLKLQAAEAILAGEVDASRLSFEAYEDISNAAAIEYSGYYDIYNSSVVGNEAVGLILAAADPDVLNEDDPSKPVTVRYTVSDLQEKDKVYKQKDSVVNFVAEMTVDGEVTELNKPVWLKVTDSNIEDGSTYTVYDDGKAIYTAVAKGNTLTFQTDSFSVFSIVETPGAETTDNTSKVEEPDETDDIYDKVNFSAHVQRRIGTDDEADIAATVSDDGIISLGTHGQSRRVEKITLTGLDADEVEMTAHVQKRVDHPEDVADLTQVVNEDGSISIGTEHQSRRIEAFSMNLKGDLAEQYDVYYRVHAQNYGWLGWAKNGEIAGTSGHSFRLEGIEIIFVEKGTEFDESQYVKTPEEGDRGYSEKAAYMDRVVSEK